MAENTIAPAQDRKLLRTLSSFTREELLRFRDYILSSYLNNKGPLIEFLDILLPLINKGKAPTGAQMLTLLLKTAKLSTATYRSLFTDLTRLVQGFIQNERYRNKPELAITDMLTAVNARRLNKLFEINLSLARKIQSNISGRGAGFYLSGFMSDTEADFHTALQKASKEKEKPALMMARMDEFYIVNKLRYACAVRHYGYHAEKEKEEDILVQELLRSIAAGRYSQTPSIRVYVAIYHMLYHEEDEKQFDDLKALLKTHQKDLATVILRDAYVFAINYCVRKVNSGKANYLREVYDLYKIALDKSFLYDEGELSPWDYSNIMALGVALRDYKWSEKFIEVYRERMPGAGKKMNVVTFNMAKLYFFGKRYKDVLALLEGVKSDELMYVLGASALLIKTYYEMGGTASLHKLLASFKTMLKKRKTIDNAERESYLLFADYVAQLSQIPRRDRKAKRDLKQDITAHPGVAEQEWLLEKVG